MKNNVKRILVWIALIMMVLGTLVAATGMIVACVSKIQANNELKDTAASIMVYSSITACLGGVGFLCLIKRK